MKFKTRYFWLMYGLTGCVMGPDYHEPEPITPAGWKAAQTGGSELQPISPESLKIWWKNFGDAHLDHLISLALTGNLDLKIALTRVDQARAGRVAARAELLPSVSLAAGAQRNQNPFPGLAPGIRYNQFELGFDAVWELDLFGRLQRRLEASSAEKDATADQYAQSLVILTADLARDYIEYRSLQNQLKINLANLDAQQHTLALTEKLFREGIATRSEVVRARVQTEAMAARIPDLEARLAAALSQLEILVGQGPGSLAAELNQTTGIPRAAGREILTSPAETIRHRPDLRLAERRLAASTAMYGAAMAELFPNISLSAFLGMRNTDIESLFKSAAFSYSTAANLLQPLLNFGRIRAGINMAESKQKEAYLGYEKAVLEALQETETALVQYLKEEIRRQSLERSVTDLLEAEQLSKRRYQQGVSSLLEVLDAQRALYAGQLDLAQSAAKTSTRLIAVYKSLGGSEGVDSKQTIPDETEPGPG